MFCVQLPIISLPALLGVSFFNVLNKTFDKVDYYNIDRCKSVRKRGIFDEFCYGFVFQNKYFIDHIAYGFYPILRFFYPILTFE